MKKIITLLFLTITVALNAQTYNNGYVTERTHDEESILVNSSDYGNDVSITVEDNKFTISFTNKNGTAVKYVLTHINGLKYKDSSGKK